jgi:hypothetical protein
MSSAARVFKLNSLLQRVRERRAEPRMVAIQGASAQTSANTNLAQRAAPALAEAPREAPLAVEDSSSTLREMAAQSAPNERRAASSIQPALHEEAAAPRSEPALQQRTSTSTVPPSPAQIAESGQRASTEVLPPAPLRIAPAPALPFEAAVKVVSSPRIETPKTFGELLEQSLALRPK